MKKSNSIILALGLVLFSCSKPEPQVGIGGTESQDGSMDYIYAAGPGVQTKTVLNNATKVLWTVGDQIALYAENSGKSLYDAIVSEPTATAKFGRVSDVTPVKAGKYYHAVYPSSALTKWGEKADAANAPFCYINIPKEQTAVKGSWDSKAAVLAASSTNTQFAFKHAVAYVRFETTQQTGDFVAVRLSAINGEMLSDSQASVQYLASGALQVAPSVSATPNVVLNNVETGTDIEAGVYYMAVLPGYYASGLKLTFTNSQNQPAEKTIGSLTLKPGEVADWGTIGKLSFGEAITPLEKFSIYEDENGEKGIVFWVDPSEPNKGKVISAYGVMSKWGSGSASTYDWAKNIDTDNGTINHQYVLGIDGSNSTNFPAVYHCNNLGEGWRLPTVNEVKELVKTYYGVTEDLVQNQTYYGVEPYSKHASDFENIMATIAEDNQATADINEAKIAMAGTTWYWTGQGNSADSKIWRVKINSGYAVGSARANNDGYVRCVRDITSE